MAVSHRTLLAIVALLALGSVAGLALLWPSFARVDEQVPSGQDGQRELIDATIEDVEPVGEVDDPGLPPGARSVVITARIERTGERKVFAMVDDRGDLYQPGDQVRLEQFPGVDDGEPTYAIADFQRGPALVGLAGLFGLAVLGFSRLRGARALFGLAVSLAIIIGFVVPAVLAGRSPLLVALVGSVAIMIVTLYLSHGFTRKTTAAVMGTAGALAVTVALGALFVDLVSLTGLSDEEARLANVQLGGVNMQGLLLAGIIIGALGVLDDVTMSQSSTVFALHRANPATGFRRLVSEALGVGRDHVAATVNTLFLAYVGASLPLLILFVTGPVGLEEVVTGQLVAVEVVRTLVGSLGLIAAVPLTTVLAAALVRGEPEVAGAGEATTALDGAAAGMPAAPGGEDAVAAALADHADGGDAGREHHARASDGAPEAGDTEAETAAAGAGDAAEPLEGDADADDGADDGADDWERRLREAYGLDESDDRSRG
jgi:uncharacterized membrane protein